MKLATRTQFDLLIDEYYKFRETAGFVGHFKVTADMQEFANREATARWEANKDLKSFANGPAPRASDFAGALSETIYASLTAGSGNVKALHTDAGVVDSTLKNGWHLDIKSRIGTNLYFNYNKRTKDKLDALGQSPELFFVCLFDKVKESDVQSAFDLKSCYIYIVPATYIAAADLLNADNPTRAYFKYTFDTKTGPLEM